MLGTRIYFSCLRQPVCVQVCVTFPLSAKCTLTIAGTVISLCSINIALDDYCSVIIANVSLSVKRSNHLLSAKSFVGPLSKTVDKWTDWFWVILVQWSQTCLCLWSRLVSRLHCDGLGFLPLHQRPSCVSNSKRHDFSINRIMHITLASLSRLAFSLKLKMMFQIFDCGTWLFF